MRNYSKHAMQQKCIEAMVQVLTIQQSTNNETLISLGVDIPLKIEPTRQRTEKVAWDAMYKREKNRSIWKRGELFKKMPERGKRIETILKKF